MKASQQRIIGNWMMSTLSPLIGGGLTFTIPVEPEWLKVVLTAFVSGSILTGIVIAQQLQNAKNKRQSS